MNGYVLTHASRVTGKPRRSILTGSTEAEALAHYFGDKPPPPDAVTVPFENAKPHYTNTTELPLDHGLTVKMEMRRDGANAHTVNKALHYYRMAHEKKSWRFMATLENEMRAALATGDFRPLQEHLMMLW